ncbi:MAG TPA: hypothetical protein VHW60_03885 [Caulobacteraceae bacterium]|jgi:hypothetical protein|nr:hypothetical protein [Caulobacteraceae bacterium]
MYVIDHAIKADPARHWALPDRVFFACGACQVLAWVALQTYAAEGFEARWIRPGPGFRGNHIIVTDGRSAFDYHGWSQLDRLLDHIERKADRWWPGWSYELVEIAPEVLVSEEKSKAVGCHMREPGQFLHDPLPRAAGFVATRACPV